MEQDKALLPFGNYPTLAEYQYERLSEIFNKVYISSKRNKFNFDVEVIEDVFETSSPMVALASILMKLDVAEVFVLSVDVPFVSNTIIKKLYSVASDSQADVIVSKSSSGLEPLCAIYRRSSLAYIERCLEQENHRLNSLLKDVNSVEVEFTEEDSFMNLNYPEDYERALKHLNACFPLTSDES
ncbi:MAG: molybdenum cofactor guanylyltransferase MobA [Epsilonproteobacteria bacterium]|nr:molybdenum cofactor guanylyltransferase MobA [Campylobacterota bacterium]